MSIEKPKIINKFMNFSVPANTIHAAPTIVLGQNFVLVHCGVTIGAIGTVYLSEIIIQEKQPSGVANTKASTSVPLRGWIRRSEGKIGGRSWSGRMPFSSDFELVINFFLTNSNDAAINTVISWSTERDTVI